MLTAIEAASVKNENKTSRTQRLQHNTENAVKKKKNNSMRDSNRKACI